MKKIENGRDEQKQWANAHFGFSVATKSLCCDREVGLPIATEILGPDRAVRETVRAREERAVLAREIELACGRQSDSVSTK